MEEIALVVLSILIVNCQWVVCQEPFSPNVLSHPPAHTITLNTNLPPPTSYPHPLVGTPAHQLTVPPVPTYYSFEQAPKVSAQLYNPSPYQNLAPILPQASAQPSTLGQPPAAPSALPQILATPSALPQTFAIPPPQPQAPTPPQLPSGFAPPPPYFQQPQQQQIGMQAPFQPNPMMYGLPQPPIDQQLQVPSPIPEVLPLPNGPNNPPQPMSSQMPSQPLAQANLGTASPQQTPVATQYQLKSRLPMGANKMPNHISIILSTNALQPGLHKQQQKL